MQAGANPFRETSKLKRNSSRAETKGQSRGDTWHSGRFKIINVDRFLPINGEDPGEEKKAEREQPEKAERKRERQREKKLRILATKNHEWLN